MVRFGCASACGSVALPIKVEAFAGYTGKSLHA